MDLFAFLGLLIQFSGVISVFYNVSEDIKILGFCLFRVLALTCLNIDECTAVRLLRKTRRSTLKTKNNSIQLMCIFKSHDPYRQS